MISIGYSAMALSSMNYYCRDLFSRDYYENRWEFMSRFCPPVYAHECEPPTATIKARSVNIRIPLRVVFQPCWRAGRWKSKT